MTLGAHHYPAPFVKCLGTCSSYSPAHVFLSPHVDISSPSAFISHPCRLTPSFQFCLTISGYRKNSHCSSFCTQYTPLYYFLPYDYSMQTSLCMSILVFWCSVFLLFKGVAWEQCKVNNYFTMCCLYYNMMRNSRFSFIISFHTG